MRSTRLVRYTRHVGQRVRGEMFAQWIRRSGGTCGDGLRIEAGTTLRWGAHAGIHIGQDVSLGRGVILDIPSGAVLHIGDRTKIMHYTIVACLSRISIGADTQVAESCSIRDSNHTTTQDAKAMAHQHVSDAVTIGDGVWIARGVAVLMGGHVGNNAVVGANSVVHRHYPVPENCTAVGMPATPLVRN